MNWGAKKMSTGKHIVILTALMLARPVALLANEPIDIGSRRELFVDQHLIDRMDGAQLVLHRPQPREVAMTFDQPWETHVYLYLTVLQDDDVYRIYYGAVPDGPGLGVTYDWDFIEAHKTQHVVFD